MSAPATSADTAQEPAPTPDRTPRSAGELAWTIARSNVLVVVLAFVFAFIIGSLLILVADEDFRATVGYFFGRPGDAFRAAGSAIGGAYAAMFRGAIFDYQGFGRVWDDLTGQGGSGTYVLFPALARGLKPLTETLTVATPLIIASCGMAVGFRAGLFNIGGTGQLIAGASVAGYIGFAFSLPPGLHLLLALLAGIVAGGIWGGIAGFLKARFGASEVISTIMLNWMATYGLAFLLTTSFFTGKDSSQPISPGVHDSAQLPLLLGPQFRLHLGIVLALAAVVFLWWLMNRSTPGFAFRAVGSNPRAAKVAGIDISRSTFGVMLVAGALVGLAGAVHVLGTEHRLTGSVAGNVGFDAITVALLGRSGPVGILLAGLLFAALTTGGSFMETSQGVPLDLVQVIQALVVLFIAAPPLVRYLVGLRRVDRSGTSRRGRARNAAATPDVGATAPDTEGAEGTTQAPAPEGADGPAGSSTREASDGPAPPPPGTEEAAEGTDGPTKGGVA
jgi:ABC-type uncharacterized transport system permease subunit